MEEVNRKIVLFDDVIPFLTLLKNKNIGIAIITNGPSDGQREKISSLELYNFTNNIFIAEEIGFSKPNIKIFNHVLKTLRISCNEAIMIGDNYEQYYMGAKKANINSLLIDRFGNYSNKLSCNKINNLSDINTKFELK